jgi:hypothetical protein
MTQKIFRSLLQSENFYLSLKLSLNTYLNMLFGKALVALATVFGLPAAVALVGLAMKHISFANSQA